MLKIFLAICLFGVLLAAPNPSTVEEHHPKHVDDHHPHHVDEHHPQHVDPHHGYYYDPHYDYHHDPHYEHHHLLPYDYYHTLPYDHYYKLGRYVDPYQHQYLYHPSGHYIWKGYPTHDDPNRPISRGFYSYLGADGHQRSVNYKIDKNGVQSFLPVVTHPIG